METTRQNKIGRLIQKELSALFQSQTQKIRGSLITVTVVRVSPDLSVAKVYLSIFPTENSEEMLKNIRTNAKSIRYDMAQRLRSQLRKIPEFSFFIDDSLDYAQNIDQLLNS